MTGANWRALAIILVLAALFRFWGTFELTQYLEEEALHVPNAVSLMQYGTTDKLNWQHPQLGGLIISGTIRLFGNNPYGWRISNVLFGIASVLLIYLIGARLYPQSAVPLLAASLLALDPFHAYLSRNTFTEIPVSFFFLLYLYLMLEYSEKRRPVLVLAGVALGLTMATKAYYVIAVPVVVFYALYTARQRKEPMRPLIIDFTAALIVLPLAIILLSYIKWFGRGYTLPEFFRMKMDAVWALQQVVSGGFINLSFLEAGGRPWEWFLKPFVLGHQRLSEGGTGRFLMQINNPPFRLLTIPSMFLIVVYAWRKRVSREMLVPVLFLSCYLLMLIVKRPMLSYSASVMLPFAYLAVARAVVLIAEWSRSERLVYSLFLCSIVLWGFYIFPLISARLVPISLYRPILSMAGFLGVF